MRRHLFFSLFLLLIPAFISAQGAFNMLRVDAAGFQNKKILMGSYEFGWKRFCISATIGTLQGTDDEYLADADVNDINKKSHIRESQSVFPATIPSHSHLEYVNSSFTGSQFRLGFTVFFRNNDTLDRHPMTGPHIGVAAVYSQIREEQNVTYKADSSQTEYFFSGINTFHCFGASTALGWQFAMFRANLYLDLRTCISFYYPIMEEPNLNSPFAGNRIEFQAGLGWHIGGSHTKKQNSKSSGTDGQDGGVIRSNI